MQLNLASVTRPRAISIFLLGCGVASLPVAYMLSNPFATSYSPMLLLGVGLSWILVRYSASAHSDTEAMFGMVALKITAILWFLGAFCVLYLFQGGYQDLFILAATIFLLACTAILAIHGSRLAFVAIFGAAILHRIPIFYSSALLLGNDPHTHANMARALQDEGSLSALFGSKYFYTPMYHTYVSVSGSVSGLPIHDVSFWVITVVYIALGMTIAAALARTISADRRAPSVAAYLFVVSDATLGWSVQPQTTTFTFALFCVVIYILTRQQTERTLVWKSLMVFIAAVMMLSQHFSAVVLVITATAFAVASGAAGGQIATNKFRILLPTVVLLSLTQWTFTYYPGTGPEMPVISAVASQFLQTSRSPQQPLPAGIDTATVTDVSLLHVVGGSLVFALAIAGIVLALREAGQRRVPITFGLAAILGTIYLVIFAGPIGFSHLYPMRWFQFAVVLLAPFASLAVVAILRIPARTHHAPRVAVVILLVSATVLMGGTYYGRLNDPTFDESPAAERYLTTEQEESLYAYVGDHAQTTTYADQRASVILDRHYGVTVETITLEYPSDRPTYVNESILLIERPYMHTHRAKYQTAVDGVLVSVFGLSNESAINCAENRIHTAGDGHTVRGTQAACAS